MPDLQGSRPRWWKERWDGIKCSWRACHLIFHRLRLLSLQLRKTTGLPSKSSGCPGRCKILCLLPCFSNWLRYAGQTPGCVYYILSGLRVMDTFQVRSNTHLAQVTFLWHPAGLPQKHFQEEKEKNDKGNWQAHYCPHPDCGKHPGK